MRLAWLKMAVIYFVIGTCLGFTMEIIDDHTLTGVHAHVNLLGWVSMAIIGLVHHFYPKVGNNVFAKVQFWLYQVGFLIMQISLALFLSNNNDDTYIPGIAVGSGVVIIAVIIFAINILANAKASQEK